MKICFCVDSTNMLVFWMVPVYWSVNGTMLIFLMVPVYWFVSINNMMIFEWYQFCSFSILVCGWCQFCGTSILVLEACP